MSGTAITSEVDFNAPGKQMGYPRVPHSEHPSACGWTPLPIPVIAGGAGPTLVVSAEGHGDEDEYEGQIAMANLARRVEAGEGRGRLILLPVLTLPAAEAGLRLLTEACDLLPCAWVFAAEPARFDVTRRSLAAGRRIANPKGRRIICDAITTPIPGAMTLAIIRAPRA